MKMNFFTVAALALCLGFTACSDDEPELNGGNENGTETEVGTVAVKNGSFKAYLHAQDYHFTENGELIQDDKVLSTTALDLTGLKMNDLSDIKLFPNVNYVDLSDNGYGPVFDFTILPEQITGVDLTGNEISEYKNLIKFEVAENGEETITTLRDLKILYLPHETKDNMFDLVRYYRQNEEAITKGDIDMQMADEKGKLAKYTTLRTIADPVLAAHLNKIFGSIFTDGKIDLSKRLNKEEKLNGVIINPYQEIENYDKLASLEGIQYIIHNPYWEGTSITIQYTDMELPKLVVPASVTMIDINKADASKGFDLSNATGLIQLYLRDVKGIETIDLSKNKVWGQRDKLTEENGFGTTLSLLGCPNVKTILFPEAKELRAYTFDIESLPALETCDLSKFVYMHGLSIGNLSDSYNLVFPNIVEFPTQPEGVPRPMDVLLFGCSEKTYNLPATTEFINKYKNYNGARKIMKGRLKYDTDKYWR